MLNNINFSIITGSSFDDSSTEYYRLDDRSSFDDPVVDIFLQSCDKKDGSEDDSDEDDNDHSHIAVKKDFPLDMKIKRGNKRTEDDISVVASDVNEDDDVVALPSPKPKPRTKKENVWDGVTPKYS